MALSLAFPKPDGFRRSDAEEVGWGARVTAQRVLGATVHKPNLAEPEPFEVARNDQFCEFLVHVV